jgi:photosystem II stability/assembly factor-like uncharacterized protein
LKEGKQMVKWRAVITGFHIFLGLSWAPAMAAQETLPIKPSLVPAFDAALRLPIARPHALAKGPGKGTPLYAATSAGLFVSADGEQWDHLSLPKAAGEEVFAVSVHPVNERVLYMGGPTGVWKSQDGGTTWSTLPRLLPEGAIPRSIAIAPGVPDVIYVGTELHGIFKSDDGGATWHPRSEGLPRGQAGERPTPIRCLAVDPTTPLIAYAGTELHGFYKTTDGGASWAAINQGLGFFPLQWRAGSPSLLIDRFDTRKMMAMLVRPLHSRLVKTFVYQSSDGGEHWFSLEVELPPDDRGIALAEDPSDPQAVALFTTKGLVRITWREIVGIADPGAQP